MCPDKESAVATATEKKTTRAPRKTAASAAAEEAPVAAQVVIDRIASETLSIPIRGTSPLVVHKFSEKAKRTMLDNMQGIKRPKQNKVPEDDYAAAFYYTKGGEYAFPAIAFKAATVGASRFYGKAVTMTSLRQFIFFHGEPGEDGQQMVVIDGEPIMREDVVRVGQGGTDLRYRPQFTEWRTLLRVTYVTSALTRDSLLSLIDAGGMGVGVGEWRPEKKGDFGCYELDPTREVEVLND